MFSSQVYLLPFLAFLSTHMIHVSRFNRFNTENIVNIRVDYFFLPFNSLPMPPRSDETTTDSSRAAGFSDPVNIASFSATLRLEDTTRNINGRLVTYLEGETFFLSALAVVRTEYRYRQQGVVCKLLEPEVDNPRVAEVMRQTELYANTVPNDYLPSYKWAEGIRCFQFPLDLAG